MMLSFYRKREIGLNMELALSVTELEFVLDRINMVDIGYNVQKKDEYE